MCEKQKLVRTGFRVDRQVYENFKLSVKGYSDSSGVKITLDQVMRFLVDYTLKLDRGKFHKMFSLYISEKMREALNGKKAGPLVQTALKLEPSVFKELKLFVAYLTEQSSITVTIEHILQFAIDRMIKLDKKEFVDLYTSYMLEKWRNI